MLSRTPDCIYQHPRSLSATKLRNFSKEVYASVDKYLIFMYFNYCGVIDQGFQKCFSFACAIGLALSLYQYSVRAKIVTVMIKARGRLTAQTLIKSLKRRIIHLHVI